MINSVKIESTLQKHLLSEILINEKCPGQLLKIANSRDIICFINSFLAVFWNSWPLMSYCNDIILDYSTAYFVQSKLFITSLIITEYSISDINMLGTDLFQLKFPLYNRIFT